MSFLTKLALLGDVINGSFTPSIDFDKFNLGNFLCFNEVLFLWFGIVFVLLFMLLFFGLALLFEEVSSFVSKGNELLFISILPLFLISILIFFIFFF